MNLEKVDPKKVTEEFKSIGIVAECLVQDGNLKSIRFGVEPNIILVDVATTYSEFLKASRPARQKLFSLLCSKDDVTETIEMIPGTEKDAARNKRDQLLKIFDSVEIIEK